MRRSLPADGGILALLLMAALAAPLPTYLLALSFFGLPHVLWELAWIRRQGGERLPAWWWRALALPLSLQALGRLAAWGGWSEGALSATIDLATLAVAIGLVLTLPGKGLRQYFVRMTALVMAAGLCLALRIDSPSLVMGLLIVLSVAHNFTPVGLVRLAPAGTDPAPGRLGGLFLLPLLVAPIPWPATFPASALIAWLPPEAGWLQERVPLPGILPALVLAQCLHYFSVLRVLPRRCASPLIPRPWIGAALTACALLSVGFLWNFPGTRRLYAVAAGLHAWLEWPILLCLAGELPAGGDAEHGAERA